MRVIVHHLNSTELAQSLEPAAHTVELTERLRGRLQSTTQRLNHAQRSHRVSEVVQSRHLEPK